MLVFNNEVLDFINQYLACNYSSFYKNPNYKEDLVQSVSLYLLERANKYDESISTVKAWATPHIKRCVHLFISELHNTSEYYGKMNTICQKAIATLLDRLIPITAESIAEETGLSINTIINCGAMSEYGFSCRYLDDVGYIPTKSVEEEIFGNNSDAIIAEAVLNMLPQLEADLINADLTKAGKQDFLQKVRKLGIKPGKETCALHEAQRHARKIAYTEFGLITKDNGKKLYPDPFKNKTA